jgi:hypothetical protein
VYERGATAAAQQMRNFGVMTSGTSVRDMQMRLLQSGEESSAKQHLMQQASGLGVGQPVVLSTSVVQPVSTAPAATSAGIDAWAEWAARKNTIEEPAPGFGVNPPSVPPGGPPGGPPHDGWGLGGPWEISGGKNSPDPP